MSTVWYGYQLAPGAAATLVLPRVRARVLDHLATAGTFADGMARPARPIMVRVFIHGHHGTYVEPRARYEWMIDGAFDDSALVPVSVDTRTDDRRPTKRALAVVDAIDHMIRGRQFLLYPLVDVDDLRGHDHLWIDHLEVPA